MKLKFIAPLLFLFSINFSQAQQRKTAEFGNPTRSEFSLIKYQKDPTANGVVLFESGKNYVEIVDNYIRLIKEVHRKIKVFDAKNFKHGTVEIPFYHDGDATEKIAKLKAITHNDQVKTYVAADAFYTTDETQNWSLKKFAFPNVKDGSILEYTYRIESPYFSNFGGWNFQGLLPKMYSEFESKIPGNYNYNRTLYGNMQLDINEAEVKKHCFNVPGFEIAAACEVATYAMFDVPAFKEEKYMLATKNYTARLDFELMKYTDLSGSTEKFSKSWDDVDKQFRYDKDFGRQLKYSNYFEDKLPTTVLSINDKMEKAKAVYYFIQNHFNWNGNYRVRSDIRVKDAFEKKSGNNSEINIALLNAMEAAGLKGDLVLLSTRGNGLPTTDYPVMTDFNFTIVKINVDDTDYLLDATNKNTPFGVLPFRDLNVQGRVMNFKKGSYWQPIVPFSKNVHYVNTQITANKGGVFTGVVNEINTGYMGWQKREDLEKNSKEEFLKEKQVRLSQLELSDYTIENQKELEEPFKESYSTKLEKSNSGKIFLNPFYIETYFTENPFNLEERNHPIDFGFPLTNTYLISIDLNNLYTVEQLPTNTALKLPNDDGSVSVVYSKGAGKVTIRLNLKLNNHSFPAEAYQGLKEFFAQVMTIQNQQPIVLKKK
ncbi:DUF3857 domain-containing protein [Marixanthomonas ophiurae]|uniref:DUF3857 domain-containing protein n=1 Tax=Marixanthomonas ophiurae TaxID=387659 RepID=A0A3E1Q8U9_9FLAO|nr:DUF3857 domain-containing protein [Marixanthomonas ophiurae]RFN58563.1 DUF3857 domain-containing protein [Marixanthomonas ophiurae]